MKKILCLLVMFSISACADGNKGEPINSDIFSEDYLRSEFTFMAGDELKYAECKKKTFPTCTYVWGATSDKDVALIKAGLTPKGNKLTVIYAQAGSSKDFQRVLATYSDAETVNGLGEEAVWSNKRKQLSLMTDNYLIVHVNIRAKGVDDLREKTIVIAKKVLEKH